MGLNSIMCGIHRSDVHANKTARGRLLIRLAYTYVCTTHERIYDWIKFSAIHNSFSRADVLLSAEDVVPNCWTTTILCFIQYFEQLPTINSCFCCAPQLLYDTILQQWWGTVRNLWIQKHNTFTLLRTQRSNTEAINPFEYVNMSLTHDVDMHTNGYIRVNTGRGAQFKGR